MRAAKVRKAPRLVASDTTSIVKDQPAGTLLKNWYAQNYGYGSFWGYIYNYSSDGDTKDIVLGANNEVWIKNPVTNFATDSWVRGYKTTGDTIEVKLPQKIYSEGSGEEEDPVFNYSAWATRLGTVEMDGEEYYDFIPTDDGIVKYVMRNDSLIKIDDSLCVSIGTSEAIPDYGYEAATWAGYAEYSFNATKMNEVATTLPANAVVETYLMAYAPTDTTTDARVVKVAIDGSDIYLSGLSDNMPDNFAKGKIEGGKAVFGLSYLGVDTVTLAHTYFSPATREYVYDEYSEAWAYDVSGADQIAFAYDAEAKTLKASEGGMLVNKGKYYVNQQEE